MQLKFSVFSNEIKKLSVCQGASFCWIRLFPLIWILTSGCIAEAANPALEGCLDEEMIYDHVIINEILPHTDPPYEDAIELYNPSTEVVCLGGWYLSDDGEEPAKYRIANGTRIGAEDYLVFYAQQFTDQARLEGSFGLSEYGEEVYLTAMGREGNVPVYQDGGSFPATANGQALGRHVASDGIVFISLQRPTFGEDDPSSVDQFRKGGGAGNAAPLVGPIVISEIHYQPAGDEDEYVSLTNISNDLMYLQHPSRSTFSWQLTDSLQFILPPDTLIAPGETILVVGQEPGVFRAQNNVPAEMAVLGPFQGQLENGGARITLSRPDRYDSEEGFMPYVVVDSLAYRNAAPWPDNTDSSFAAIGKLVQPDIGDDGANWGLVEAPVWVAVP